MEYREKAFDTKVAAYLWWLDMIRMNWRKHTSCTIDGTYVLVLSRPLE